MVTFQISQKRSTTPNVEDRKYENGNKTKASNKTVQVGININHADA